MQIEVVFRNLTPSESLKSYADKRFQKLARLAGEDDEARLLVTLSMESGKPRVDTLLTGQNLNVAASEKNDDMYAAIDLCNDRMSQQLRKASERRSQINRDTVLDAIDKNA
jgi:putative sigma-54 modulation protein